MNTDTLTLLGCSSSLALILLTTSPAIAASVTPQPANSFHPTLTLAQQDSQYTSVESSDAKAEIAKAILGCSCPTCQSRLDRMNISSPNLL